MGRTLPSTTVLAFELVAELRPFYDALRLNDQLVLDKLFEKTLQHRSAIDHAKSLLPMEVAPFAILLEERKRNNEMFIEIFRQMEDLEKNLIYALPPDELWRDER
jgi:hypothetical protein